MILVNQFWQFKKLLARVDLLSVRLHATDGRTTDCLVGSCCGQKVVVKKPLRC